MSNRTLVELNHDHCPREGDLLKWAKAMRTYMSSGDKAYLPQGVEFRHIRHHSEPCPLEEITRLRSELKQAQRINSDFQVWLDRLANGELDAQSTKDAEMRAEKTEAELGKAQEEIKRLTPDSGA